MKASSDPSKYTLQIPMVTMAGQLKQSLEPKPQTFKSSTLNTLKALTPPCPPPGDPPNPRTPPPPQPDKKATRPEAGLGALILQIDLQA